ncbi:cation-translocating P-type ATPase [Porphyromonas sp.]|uniref:heavy metal translocating P-type ATPase n=1 Tax=Porphyromonas sp. TaxID=1924944 RepID=UPI0026DC9A4C|nr:heavy metal translocating P-type ATPase [Porphyromonas sp.]MDO4695650.1 heavy metal translocating P-type ATPase [Porphyromonas sp.]MDO4771621.1 heavy metal translocating P-type ATPase [Porphyromonas sp.]
MKTKGIYNITGMACAGCVAHVQDTIAKLNGLISVEVALVEGRAVIEYDPDLITPEEIKFTVDAMGYRLLLGDPKERECEQRNLEKKRLSSIRNKLIIAILMAVVMMISGMWHEAIGLIHHDAQIVQAIAATVVYFFCAWDYHVRTLKLLRFFSFTMDTLISMSITVAYLFSMFRLFFITDETMSSVFRHSYFDVVGMIMSFVLLGKFIEENAKKRTTDSLRRLIDLTPQTAMVKNALGEYEERAIDEIKIGDHVLIRKGDRVPVDGLLIGTGSFDESSITGESLPVERGENDLVLSGSVSVGTPVVLVAHKVGADTVLSRIIETVRQAQASKAPIQRIADKISGIFVPVILTLSLVTFLLWGFLGSEDAWIHGLYFGISTLVIACPCALGLATPTAITVGVGAASEKGILIRDAVALELLGKVTDIVFDKTGTLTSGIPMVSSALWMVETDEYKSLLVSAEKYSSHPLSGALIRIYGKYQRDHDISDFKEASGKGISFTHKDEAYCIGNKALVGDFTYRAHEGATITDFEDRHSSSTLIYYTRSNKLLAIFALEDEVLSDAKITVATLRKEGVRVHILSGDRDERVVKVAKQLEVDSFRGGVMPEDKKGYIDELRQNNGGVVAMIGDGINDSPALASADVSIAIATGADIAMDIAMVTIMGKSVDPIVQALHLSRRTSRIIKQNFFWAFFYNLIAVPIAAGLFYPAVFISPMWAAGAMAASSICVVLNSLRIKK